MEEPKAKIHSILENIAEEMGVSDVNFLVERPKDQQHGDFATNIALTLFANPKSKILNPKSPFDLAQKIVEKIKSQNLNIFDKIEAVAPGFINFYLSKSYLQNQVQNIIQKGDSYGSSSIGSGKKVSVEFVSANPTGPLHIGNARGGPLGDTIANVLAKAGYIVTREYLHNDVGGQIERLGEAIYYQLHPDQKTETYEVQYQGEYIKELAKAVEEELQDKDMDLSAERLMEEASKIAVELMLTEILKDCEQMGIKFDKVRKESDLRKEVPQVLSKITKFLKEKDGAKWFAPQDEFLKDRETVVKKSDGQFTYFASDIVYHSEKIAANDVVIDILGANHSGHEPRLKAVVKALGYDPDSLKVILYQWIRLKRGVEIVKMSKRAGNFVTAKEVLDEVGKDAFRFFLLTPRTQTHMDFDMELAKKRSSENPVFYVQYAYTRICSIFDKSQIANPKAQEDLSLLKETEELLLVRKLIEFPYLVEEIAQNFEVNAFVNYALELANLFHKFYEAHQVISQDSKSTEARLALLKATQITLKNTLDLLGVSSPEQM
jgi:arginyl-tRNA synthetase